MYNRNTCKKLAYTSDGLLYDTSTTVNVMMMLIIVINLFHCVEFIPGFVPAPNVHENRTVIIEYFP